MDESNELIQQRVRNWRPEEGRVDPFPNDFRVTHTTSEIHETYGDKSDEELKSVSEHFSLAGRVWRSGTSGKPVLFKFRMEEEGSRLISRKMLWGTKLSTF